MHAEHLLLHAIEQGIGLQEEADVKIKTGKKSKHEKIQKSEEIKIIIGKNNTNLKRVNWHYQIIT